MGSGSAGVPVAESAAGQAAAAAGFARPRRSVTQEEVETQEERGAIKVSSESDTDSDADSELLGLKRLAAHLACRGVEMDPHAVRRNIDEQIASRRRPRPRRSETQEEAETQEERGRVRERTPLTQRRLRSTRGRLRRYTCAPRQWRRRDGLSVSPVAVSVASS